MAFEEPPEHFPGFAVDEAGVERQVNINVRGRTRLPLVIESRGVVRTPQLRPAGSAEVSGLS